MTEQHRRTYLALVAAMRAEFQPTSLEALWIQMRGHRYNTTSLGVLAQAVHDAHDLTYDAGTGDEVEQLRAELAEAREHLTLDRQAVATLRQREQEVGRLTAENARVRQQRDEALSETADLREQFVALAAIEEYIGESCGNASHNIRDVLAGQDPRPDAVRCGLEFRAAGHTYEVREATQ